MSGPLRPLSSFLASERNSVDPALFPRETFDLYSIPAYDTGQSDLVQGSSIGSTKQTVRPGDVLLSKIVPHLRRAWIVGPDRGYRAIGSGEWIVFRSPQIESAYLRQVLLGNTFHQEFMRTVAGVGGSLLRARPSQVAQIQIPVPPLDEQRRIAAILDKADTLRAKRRAAIAKLESLTQSIFLDMLQREIHT
jgi:type I restriction enzyme S subunit